MHPNPGLPCISKPLSFSKQITTYGADGDVLRSQTPIVFQQSWSESEIAANSYPYRFPYILQNSHTQPLSFSARLHTVPQFGGIVQKKPLSFSSNLNQNGHISLAAGGIKLKSGFSQFGRLTDPAIYIYT